MLYLITIIIIKLIKSIYFHFYFVNRNNPEKDKKMQKNIFAVTKKGPPFCKEVLLCAVQEIVLRLMRVFIDAEIYTIQWHQLCFFRKFID